VIRKSVLLLLFCLVCASWLLAQSDNAMAYGTPAKSKFAKMPNIPDCVKIAVERGDPSKGPSVLLLKFEPGCTIPLHWHTAGETLIIVKGTGKMQMKDGQPMPAGAGDFVYLPGKNVHTFRSTSAVLLYDLPDGAFDIHYVDKSGNEIPFGDAIKQVVKVKPASGPTTSIPQ
jgi:quercetin dioxygenase-like cupin family protein